MLRKYSSCQKLYPCFHCSLKGRNYSQGHASAGISAAPIADDIISKPETVSTPTVKQEESIVNETKCRLQIALGETSKLLAASRYKLDPRLKPSRGRWKTALQAFENGFQQGNGCAKIDPDITRNKLGSKELEQENTTPTTKPVARRRKALALSVYMNDQMKVESEAKAVKRVDSHSKAKSPKVADEDATHVSAYDFIRKQKIKIFAKQFSAFVKVLLDEKRKPDVIRDYLSVFLINREITNSWFVNRKIADSQLPNILLKNFARNKRMRDSTLFYQQMMWMSAPADIHTFIWMLFAALRSDHPKANADWVMEKMDSQNCTHLLAPALHEYIEGLKSEEREEIVQGLLTLYPDIDLAADKSICSASVAYTHPVAASLNIPKEFDNPHAGVISPQLASSYVDEHIANEVTSTVSIDSTVPPKLTGKTFQARETYRLMREQWREALNSNLHAALELLKHEGELHNLQWVQSFLACMPADIFTDIMLEEASLMCEMSLHYSPNYRSLCKTLGDRVRKRYMVYRNEHRIDDIKNVHTDYINNYYNSAKHNTTHRQMFAEADATSMLRQFTEERWPYSVINVIGGFLFDTILKSAKVPVELLKQGVNTEPLPAFYAVSRFVGNMTIKQIKPHPSIVKLTEEAQLQKLYIDVVNLPTFIPPIPFQDESTGVFFQTHVNFLKVGRENYFGKPEREDILPVLDALNALAAVPWKINTTVSDLITMVYNDGGDSRLGVPLDTDSVTVDNNGCEKFSPREAKSKLKKLQTDSISERASFLLGLSVANHCGKNAFWLPHNLDFRGRAYPLSTHFSHVASDPKRAMLRFAKGKPLGSRGLEWLKIHLVNMTGEKKRASNAERLAYADELVPLAIQSADNPFEGEQWWKEMDTPWQGLATCIELKAAYSRGDPEDFVSHLPIHQDGSCNGLQHYSALGGDKLGAVAVNVLPSDTPRDIYSDVAAMLEEQRSADAAKGHAIAMLLENNITRKVVKQTVMTTVYGVTRFGANIQVKNHLSDQAPHLSEQNLVQAANYVTDRLLQTLSTMFSAGTEIQDWLTLCAHLITTVANKPVTWRTPLGLQVTQHYWRKAGKDSKGSGDGSSSLTYGARHNTQLEKPDVNKQMNSFPPNFVHSLDATHMMLTTLQCQRAGLTFASIHDCYWTHASDVDTMNKALREAFCDLYKQPILGDLSQYMLDMYVDPNNPAHKRLETVIRSVPQQGDLDIERVKQSDYFFN